MPIVTIFKNAKDTKNPFHVDSSAIVKRIKDGKSRALVEKIRTEQDIKERKELKKNLPSICFSGKFSERKDSALITHSGLVAIDFDHLGDRLLDFKHRLTQDKFTHIAFISPSGDGLKVVVRIPDQIETHKLSCDALSDYYKEEALDEFKDVSRLCFESYDPDIYYNPESDVFRTLKETQTIKKTVEITNIITDFDKIIDNIVTWLGNKGEHYRDGNKHSYLVKFASACNRFGISESIACQKAIYKFIHTASSVDPNDFVELFHRVYKNYGHLSCTAHFDSKGIGIETITKTVLTEAIFDITLPLKDVIYLDNVRDSMLESFHSGRARGETTHFNVIDDHWRWKRGHLVLWHGIMNHGKSSLLMQMCLIKSVKKDYKWAFFSPEQDPPDDFYDDLIHAYVGKNTQPYFDEQMTEQEYIKGMDFIKDHFFYIFPDDDTPTQDYINKRFDEVIKKHKIDGCIIDPYNQLDNDIRKNGGREDQYLSSFLTIQKRFAQKHNIFMNIVTHPKSGLVKNTAGDYGCPDIFDLSGGAMWGNKCDDIICVYRPFFSSDKTDTTVKFISQKIKKRKLCGMPGDVIMDYDIKSGRYFENKNGIKFNPLGKYTKEEKPGMNSYYEPEKFNPDETCPY
jgi:hypothetical protein